MNKRKRKNSIGVNQKRQKLENESEKCPICNQSLNDVICYKPFKKSSEELVALTDEKLSVFTGKEQSIDENDKLPTHKITNFTVYDEHGHLCHFDNDLIERNKILYFSGYIKPIYDEDKSCRNGVAAYRMGPINEWYIAGFDGGTTAIAGLVTPYAQYILVEPSVEYKSFMKLFKRKMMLVKVVIEFLLERVCKDPSFEDLLTYIKSFRKDDGLDEDFLLEYAQFVCDQIYSFDKAGTEDDFSMLDTSCVKDLVNLSGVSLNERKNLISNLNNYKKTPKDLTKAVSTPIVRSVFESFFPDQIKIESPLRKSRQHLENIQELKKTEVESKTKQQSKRATKLQKSKTGNFYDAALVGDLKIFLGDFIFLNKSSDNSGLNRKIGKVVNLTKASVHVQLFLHGSETVLGETADSQELFMVEECEDFSFNEIESKTEVMFKGVSEDWFQQGGNFTKTGPGRRSSAFYFTKKYERKTGTFFDYQPENHDGRDCEVCIKRQNKAQCERPVLENGSVKFKNYSYEVNSGVFMKPTIYNLISIENENEQKKEMIVDENMYPEYFRKNTQIKGVGDRTLNPNPFLIGMIEEIFEQNTEIMIKVRIFLRPENTKQSIFLAHTSQWNLIYWTEEVVTTAFTNVRGKCYLHYTENASWSNEGPYRFFFSCAYNPKTFQFDELPSNAKETLQKLECKLNCSPTWPKIESPLRCLDVFAGCGGLSLGLHQAGIAQTLWAIEKEPTAAKAFKVNNSNCKVFTNDCNEILQEIISNKKSKELPRKGQVDLLVGGPPCQGFSVMNQFNSGQYSLFKNSLVVSLLSYCEYLRPKYFVLENVKHFIVFKRSMVLKLTIKCLLAIGYQVRFGILQAGHFGIPQTRRRLILIAAAPGYILPDFPEPQHVFSKAACNLGVSIDGKKFVNGQTWIDSAPYRAICIRDAISDLPEIKNGWKKEEMAYDNEAVSYFQRKMRNNCKILYDHICKEMSSIVLARICHIPVIPGSDWRDLPNISIELNNGSKTDILQYPYRTKKANQIVKGVCQCILGKKCLSSDRQTNTLIPWCLPHTADRHNNWVGLYGRLEWDGHFPTTITNPEPMGKQGRVLHPEKNRVVSVRECARSQGFPDNFRFHGTVMDKHRQVGNAVPPPVGQAIGIEILKSYARSNTKQCILSVHE